MFPGLSTVIGSVARKRCFLVCPPLGNMARKQCFLVCPPSANMARKQCFLVCPPSANMASKQCFLVCPALVYIYALLMKCYFLCIIMLDREPFFICFFGNKGGGMTLSRCLSESIGSCKYFLT